LTVAANKFSGEERHSERAPATRAAKKTTHALIFARPSQGACFSVFGAVPGSQPEPPFLDALISR